MENDPMAEKISSPNYEAYKNIGDEVPFRGSAKASSEELASGEAIDRDIFISTVHKIINHPGFSFEESGQPAEYDDKKLDELYKAISQFKERVDNDEKYLGLEIPDRIETILAEDEEKYPFNNNYQDITARTADGLFNGRGANCIGFAETCCIMLSLYGYKPTPVLSRLNKSGAACHYVTCFENKDGKVEILDPERKRSCSEEEKQYDLTAYQGSLRYAVPSKEFSRIKIGGPNGIGPAFDDYFGSRQDQVVRPMNLMTKKLSRENDNIGMYEQETVKPLRVNLKAASMNARKKELLDVVISDTLQPIYEQSLALMSESEA